uniref:Uncharacterized protein LOC8281386 isoform X2 n=1 Tax=Rhizophora mucronata TaxID=61149 RepID=A0A2P2PWJ1_RHIMU
MQLMELRWGCPKGAIGGCCNTGYPIGLLSGIGWIPFCIGVKGIFGGTGCFIK